MDLLVSRWAGELKGQELANGSNPLQLLIATSY
jgi:hypothetical protein